MKSFKEFTDANEALTLSQRQKRKAVFRKNKAKIMIARKKAAKKLASPEQARNLIVKKILKNKTKDDLSMSARGELEKKVDKKKAAIKKIAKKLLPMVKKADRAKIKNKNNTPGQ